jgi:hypothetical protein
MKTLYLALIISFLSISGCDSFNSEENDVIDCWTAGWVLQNKDREILKNQFKHESNNPYEFQEMEDAAKWKLGQLPETIKAEEITPENSREVRKQSEKIAQSRATLGNRDKKTSDILDLYNSDVCQSIMDEYQRKVEQDIGIYFKSMVKNKNDKVTCEILNEQLIKYGDYEKTRHKENIKNGMLLTIKDSLPSFNEKELLCVDSLIRNDFDVSIFAILSGCEDGELLSNYLVSTKGIQNCQE